MANAHFFHYEKNITFLFLGAISDFTSEYYKYFNQQFWPTNKVWFWLPYRQDYFISIISFNSHFFTKKKYT